MLEHLKDYAYPRQVAPEKFAHMVDWLLQRRWLGLPCGGNAIEPSARLPQE